jgi:hypothetical protein
MVTKEAREEAAMLLGQKKGERWCDPRLGRMDDEYLKGCLARAEANEEAIPLVRALSEDDDDGQGD